MKLQFVCYDNIDVIKSNLDSWVNKFKQPSSDWLSEELNQPLFSDTKEGISYRSGKCNPGL